MSYKITIEVISDNQFSKDEVMKLFSSETVGSQKAEAGDLNPPNEFTEAEVNAKNELDAGIEPEVIVESEQPSFPVEDSTPVPAETVVETPTDTPVETPVDAPQINVDAPVDNTAPAPADIPADAPVNNSVETPAG